MEMYQRLREARKKKGLTQKDMAEVFGVSQQAYANYETGIRSLTEAIIHTACDKLQINETWLRSGDGEMFIEETVSEKNAYLMGKIVQREDVSEEIYEILSGVAEFEPELIKALALIVMTMHQKHDTKE